MKHAPNTIFRISICLGVSLCGWALAADDKKEAARKAALEAADRKAFAENMAAYKDAVRPFLEKHCIGCHGPKKLKGDLALDLLDPDMKESTTANLYTTFLNIAGHPAERFGMADPNLKDLDQTGPLTELLA